MSRRPRIWPILVIRNRRCGSRWCGRRCSDPTWIDGCWTAFEANAAAEQKRQSRAALPLVYENCGRSRGGSCRWKPDDIVGKRMSAPFWPMAPLSRLTDCCVPAATARRMDDQRGRLRQRRRPGVDHRWSATAAWPCSGPGGPPDASPRRHTHWGTDEAAIADLADGEDVAAERQHQPALGIIVLGRTGDEAIVLPPSYSWASTKRAVASSAGG